MTSFQVSDEALALALGDQSVRRGLEASLARRGHNGALETAAPAQLRDALIAFAAPQERRQTSVTR